MLDQIETGPSELSYANDVGALIGHIVSSHHTYLRRELPRLGDLMEKVIAAHGEAHPEVHDLAATLSWRVVRGLAVEAEARHTIGGRNTLRGTRWSLGLATSPAWRLWRPEP